MEPSIWHGTFNVPPQISDYQSFDTLVSEEYSVVGNQMIFTFNETGLTYLNQKGLQKFVFRNIYDANNVQPPNGLDVVTILDTTDAYFELIIQ
jgi:hypothetical protein